MSFEITHRAAAGRIGKFRTAHGNVTTPTMMPVINPNIELVTAQEMREHWGCEMVITNSYVIFKHDHLREKALAEGVHALLNWDGVVMTDSGTFQSYVYGDVELDPHDIVKFQADMGVDVATCLDRFATPDMTREEVEECVSETLVRTQQALEAIGRDPTPGAHHEGERPTLLNATVQGGTHTDLRQACAAAYRELDVDYQTIGGVVPVMERQMYPELVDIILASQLTLRKDRPVHLFGAGHPMIFPLAVALGCDLFDSSSYAKYAKDGRLMHSEGTLHICDLTEWTHPVRFLVDYTPESFTKALNSKGETRHKALKALAMENLDACFTELRRIRQAIRDGVLWELVEQRSTAHPFLAAAVRKLRNHQEWLEAREPVSGDRALRYTGSLTHQRPMFHRIRKRLQTTPMVAAKVEVDPSDWAPEGGEKIELGMHKETGKPFFPDSLLDAEMEHVTVSALGVTPMGLEEMYPFAQSVLPRLDGLDREHMGWVGDTKDAFLASHEAVPTIPGPAGSLPLDRGFLQILRTADWQFGPGAGVLMTGAEKVGGQLRPSLQFRVERSRKTNKIRTVYLGDEHILSLRAQDGMFTLKPAGARLLHAGLKQAMRVVVDDDSVPFNREGKSVFAQFVLEVDEALRPGDECLVVDRADNLIAVGKLLLAPEECHDFQNGMAVKVRDGLAA